MEEDNKLFEDNTKIIKVPVIDEMKKSFISYAMAVNVSRAIPDVRDGLKPVHRRILYAMSELNLFNDKPYRKCARIVGDVLGKYHPHGDSAVYDALVRLAQDFTMRVPLVDGHGNFGSVDGDPAAAQRYTEARLSKIAAEMIRDIDKDCVDWTPNFDDTLMQPVVLPSRYPNLLVNGADGIAVGMATSIPPHNLGEVIDGVIALINNPDISIDELMNYIKAPDFPTGAIIMGRMGVRQAYKTGHGKVVVRSRCEIEDDNGKCRIVVTEIPYQVNKAQLIMQMAQLVKDKKIEGIADIKEESDRDGMRIVIDIKRDANPQVVLNLLYKHSQLQTSTGIIFLALVNGEPKVLNLKEILYHYLEHQKQIVLRRSVYDLERAREREHIVRGLVIALQNIDEVVKIIRASKEKSEAMQKLCDSFALSEKQANAILEMRLVRLTALEVGKLKDELEALSKFCAEMESIINNPNKVLAIIAKELTEIKEKYSDVRRTEISHDVGSIDIEDLIAKEDMVVSMTNQGYIKRMAVTEYHTQNRGGVGIHSHKTKDNDYVDKMFIANTHDNLMFFTNLGRVYTVKTYEVPESSRIGKGRALINLLQLNQGENATAVICMKNDKGIAVDENGNQVDVPKPKYLVMATKLGLIKKTPVEEFKYIMKVGKRAITLDEGDELISVQMSYGDDEVLLATTNGKCIRFSEHDIRAMGRTARGVKSIKLADGASVVDMSVIRPNTQILTITENGFGKRASVNDYRKQSRGGMGVSAGKLNEKTGQVVAMKQIDEGDDILIIANNGTVIRVNSLDVRLLSRTSMGVKMMKLKGNSRIASVAVIAKEMQQPQNDDGNSELLNEIAERNLDGFAESSLHEDKEDTYVETDEETFAENIKLADVDYDTLTNAEKLLEENEDEFSQSKDEAEEFLEDEGLLNKDKDLE